MKLHPLRFIHALSTCLFLFFGISLAAGQTAGTGTIEGRVLNGTNGQYVKNARVTIEGTTLEALTGEFGEYRVFDVPAGSASVRVSYGGLPTTTMSVTVAPGSTVQHDVTVGAPHDGTGETLRLDEFVVSSSRETNAAAIATNEQRHAANIKNVVSSDAFGDVTEGNVGEFLKYLPGVAVNYVGPDVRRISVRGFDDNFTNVAMDGGTVVSAPDGGTNRAFELEQVSINNIARIEVTKVPTPDMPADGLGGSINMVSRSAFEHTRPQFRYKVNLSVHSEHRDEIFRKSPGPGNEKTFKALPGFDFNYIAPISKTFGIVINGLVSNQFYDSHRSLPAWNYNNVNAGATPTNPFLRQYRMQIGSKVTHRSSFSMTADWKPAPGHVISVRGQTSYYNAFFGNRNVNYDVGNNPAPTPASGRRLEFSPEFTHGATGRGTVSLGGSYRDKLGASSAVNATHRFIGREWSTEAGINASFSRTWYRDLGRGFFESVTAQMVGIESVRYDDITYPRPGGISVLAPTGGTIDDHSLANYRITTATESPNDGEASNRGAFANVKRSFQLGSVPFSLKAGGSIRSEVRDNRRYEISYTHLGADGIANTADDVAVPYIDKEYSTVDPYWGLQPYQWVDFYKVADAFHANPAHFAATPAQLVTNETNRINGSERIQEVITAGFLQGELNLVGNRLRIVTGVRYEKTEDTGEGPLFDPDAVFERNADGSFVVSNGARVRRASAGAAGSLEELAVIRRERAARGSRSYDGFFPSLHTSFEITENLLARFAYAKTFGRPNFGEIIPNTIIDADDSVDPAPGSPPGDITLRNPGLKPWIAHNFDVSLEYYFRKGGLLSVGGFQKEISNFWDTLTTIVTPETAAEHGLDPVYVGWELHTRKNGGDARISGFEINYNQPLNFIPQVGRYFSLSANMTRLHLEGSRAGDFRNFIPRTGNIGLTFNRQPFNVKINLNHRGQQRLSTNDQIEGFLFELPRTYIDINAEYRFSRRVTFFLNGRNITNEPQDRAFIGINPAYSQQQRVEEFGIQWGLGIKGTF